MDALTFYGDAVGGLQETERRLLTIMALCGTESLTGLVELCTACDLRESPTRQLSTVTLRPKLQVLVTAGVVVEGRHGFHCRTVARHPTLRRAASDGSLHALARAVGAQMYPPRSFGYAGDRAEQLAFDASVSLAALDSSTEANVAAWLATEPGDDAVDGVLLPALAVPFDAGWFARVPPGLKALLLQHTLPRAECLGLPLPGLYEYLGSHLDLVTASTTVLTALGGVALLRNDAELLVTLASLSEETDTGKAIAGARALTLGRTEEALARFACTPGKKQRLYAGVAGVLHVLALARRGGPDDLELALRLAGIGAKRPHPFRQSHALLKSIAEVMRRPNLATEVPHLLRPEPPSDCMAVLLRMLFAIWFEVPQRERELSCEMGVDLRGDLRAMGTPWLLAQYDRALQALATKVVSPELRHGAAEPSNPRAPANIFALLELRVTKEPWELALEGLERVARVTGGVKVDDAAIDERIVWKVDPRRFEIEPFLQRRASGSWTGGRKLAIKHLLPSAPQLKKLPPEDVKVAAYAREYRESFGGYPKTTYLIDRRAWPALIGHPRVFLSEDERHVEVTRGNVQLVASSRDDAFVVTLDPPDLVSALELRMNAGRIVVFEIEEPLRAVVNLFGKGGLSFPAAARARALGALAGLTHLLPVQSSEQLSGTTVTADPRPWLRLLPRAGGLSISISARPLGGDGPHCNPGEGAPTLVGRSKGESLQTARDLDEERNLAERAILECEALAGHETGEGAWLVEDPHACLELVSALRRLGESVHVEWPQGSPLNLRGRLAMKSLRGKLQREEGSFFATGRLAVDDELSLDLSELVLLLAERPGKFVRLASGEYIELEDTLRETLESLSTFAAAGRGKRSGLAIPNTALSVLDRLTADDSGLELDDAATAWRERLRKATDTHAPVPRALNAELRSYQVEGFRWMARLADLELGACLADDMGLGKTVQLIALLLHRSRSGPALVVAPTSVCENWRRELARFAPSLVVRSFLGAGRDEALGKLAKRQVVLTSYGLLQQDASKLQAIEWGTVVLDEAQLIKNAESQRSKAAFGLRAQVRIAATGTPVENHLGDVFSIFHFLLPGLLGSWAQFNRRFGSSAGGEGASASRRALRRLLLPFVLRRTKAQVLDDLPALTDIERTVTLGPEEAALYEAVRRAALAKLGSSGSDPRARVQVLAEITRLRRLCCHPALAVPGATVESSKIASFLELAHELIEGRHRALVFSQFVDVLTLVRAELDKKKIAYQYLDGSTAPKQRSAAVDAFQSGQGELFLISLRAGGFGLNLTAADYVIHLDPWWNPAVEAQASDRAHRIGQTRPVTVYRLVVKDTVEERIVALHRSKRELADSLLEDTDRAATMSVDDLRALLDE